MGLRRKLRGKKLLVASASMAAISYVGCGPEAAPPGNLVAPPVEEAPPGNLVAPPPIEEAPPGNLVAPPPIEEGPVVPDEGDVEPDEGDDEQEVAAEE